MSTYVLPIQMAILIFPILAAIITIPYIIIQYRRYGAMHPLRVAIVYSFIFYLLCAYFLVILPLPPIEDVANYTTPITQLIPFEGYREFTISTSLVLNDPSTYWSALNEPSLFLILFNILLTVPFGIYLRYYFECSWKKTLLWSFLLTLSFECIQLSALFGIYPRPYRLFDVDDLMNNTLGGMLGYGITPLLTHFLPSRTTLDETSLHKGKSVSSLRRVVAFFIDIVLLALLCMISMLVLLLLDLVSLRTISITMLYVYIVFVLLIIVVLAIFTKGKTIGKFVVKIRLVNKEDQSPRWYQQSVHYIAIYLLILPCPYVIVLLLIQYFQTSTSSVSYEILLAACIFVFYIASLIQCIPTLFHKGHTTWYDKTWRLHNISTLHEEQPRDVETTVLPQTETSASQDK